MIPAPEEYPTAVSLWRIGFSVNEIAKALGITRGQLLGWTHRNRSDFPFRSEAARRARS